MASAELHRTALYRAGERVFSLLRASIRTEALREAVTKYIDNGLSPKCAIG